jgi:hypothetical protein
MRFTMRHFLSPDDQLFFMHIPKTAGTSFTRVLESHFHRDDHFPAHNWKAAHQRPELCFDQYRLFTGHYLYTFSNELQRPVIVTILRDPVERALSHFEQLKRAGKASLLSKENMPVWSDRGRSPFATDWHDDISLSEYLNNPYLRFDAQNLQTRYLGNRRTMQELWERRGRIRRRTAPVKSVLPCALERLETMAFVGLVERFSESVDLLTYTFGWQPETSMPDYNRASKRLAQQDLSPDLLALLRSLNAGDIALYQHAETLFQRRLDAMRQDLLHLDYAQRYHAVKTDHLHLDMNGILPGTGWHPPDPDHPNLRWTGPTNEATLDLPLIRDTPMRLSFNILDVLAQDILDSFHVTVNGRPLELISQPRQAGGLVVSGEMTPDTLASPSPFTRISFHVNRTIRPSSILPDNLDDRPLGVALSAIEVTPVASNAP